MEPAYLYVECPCCGQSLEIDARVIGHEFNCPTCAVRLMMPAEEAPDSSAEQPEPPQPSFRVTQSLPPEFEFVPATARSASQTAKFCPECGEPMSPHTTECITCGYEQEVSNRGTNE